MCEEKIIKEFTVRIEDGYSQESQNELSYAVHGKEMAMAISDFLSELRYRFKHREMSEEAENLHEEIFDLALEKFKDLPNIVF